MAHWVKNLVLSMHWLSSLLWRGFNPWPRNFRFVLHAKGRLAQGTSSPEIEMGQTEESTLIYSVNKH